MDAVVRETEEAVHIELLANFFASIAAFSGPMQSCCISMEGYGIWRKFQECRKRDRRPSSAGPYYQISA
jgi:hypothetical protein